MITGIAHTGVCVPDCEAAVAWYRDVLGFQVLSPPFLMEGEALDRDMGELVPQPRMKAAIVGFPGDDDRVLEVIEWPDVAPQDGRVSAALTDTGLTHVALICTDIEATRRELEAKDVRFLVSGIADITQLRTTWFADPWGTVIAEAPDGVGVTFAEPDLAQVERVRQILPSLRHRRLQPSC